MEDCTNSPFKSTPRSLYLGDSVNYGLQNFHPLLNRTLVLRTPLRADEVMPPFLLPHFLP